MQDYAPTLLTIVNIVMGLLMFWLDVKYYRSTKEPWKWVKALYAVVGLYWALLYAYVFLFPGHGNPITFGQTWVRPAITVTLAAMAAGSIIRVRKP